MVFGLRSGLWQDSTERCRAGAVDLSRQGRLRQTTQWCFAGASAVALLAAAGFRLHLSFLTVSFCYLLLVVAHSLSGDFIASAVVALLSVGCLDYFFVDPVFSFQVNRPLDTLGLASFLTIALVITSLVTKVRAGTELSRLNNEKLQRLHNLAQELFAVEPDAKGGIQLLDPFCGVFGIRAVCLFDAASADVHVAGKVSEALEKKTGEAYIHGKDQQERESGITARCIRVGGRTTGAIGFEGLEDPDLTAGPLASLAAAHLERTHSFHRASQAAAAAQTEAYRTAILDALAHEFKTPLSTILTAAGALREAPSLSPENREMAETVESEAARLGRLASRLIRTARLEREEVKPWVELIDVDSVIADAVNQYSRPSAGRRILVMKESECCEVMADPELLRLAISQLLDNACKYSNPESTVTLSLTRAQNEVVLRVRSTGNAIPPGERSKIFDRFYRGTDGRRVGPGSGLGLFVARKIALALGGSLDLDTNLENADGAVFRLALPIPEGERYGVTAVM
jgi:two-component system sensor histidine kinase KdpD